jgi:hypothetical protein
MLVSFSVDMRDTDVPLNTLRAKRPDRFARFEQGTSMPTALRVEARMNAAEIDRLDQDNALLEIDHIVARVRAMADVRYHLDIEEVWEFLEIWAAGGNADARKLLSSFKAAVGRALPALEATR